MRWGGEVLRAPLARRASGWLMPLSMSATADDFAAVSRLLSGLRSSQVAASCGSNSALHHCLTPAHTAATARRAASLAVTVHQQCLALCTLMGSAVYVGYCNDQVQ